MAARGSTPAGPETVAEWRAQLLQRAFTFMFVLVAALLVSESLASLRSGDWNALPSLAVAVFLQGLAAFARGLRPRVRILLFTAAGWLGMGWGLVTLGFALPIPFMAAIMTLTLLALCAGAHFALASLLVFVVVLLLDGYYICCLRQSPPPSVGAAGILDQTSFPNWIRITAGFSLFAGASIAAVVFLVRRLERSMERNGELFQELDQESQAKIRALEERQVLMEKVRRSNELQMLGLLSAAVAHDFNNLLMVILGNAALLGEEVRGNARQDLADIEQAGQQAADLCHSLLTLARERVSDFETLELNRLIEAELPILRRLVTSKVRVEWKPGPELWLEGVRTEMRQILLNLCANARDAMPDGGPLRISTARVERAAPGQTAPSAFSCLAVRDEGVGMDEATRQRIFEPFFTTKAKTKGTGLGMAVVAAAVEQHAGFLEVASSPGAGTTFSVFLPLVAAPRSEPAARGPRAPNTLSGSETILVVDDDEGVLKTLRRYLEKHGYSVLGASTGQEAVDVFLRAENVDLVVSDVVMPAMGGLALFQTVNERRPDVPFLFCSGLPAGSVAPEILEQPHRALLAKPFSEEVLLRKVRQLLDRPRRG